jgi:chaperonin GroEL
MSKYVKLSQGQQARRDIAAGVRKLTAAVGATLGPSGRNVIIEQSVGNPISTKDGVTVAKAIHLKDSYEDIGIQIVKQASIKTGDQAGDGTTTSTILAGELYTSAIAKIEEGEQDSTIVNSVDIRRGMERAGHLAADYLESISREITNEEQLKQVATISGNNDTQVGEIVSLAMSKSGVEGVVTVEDSRTGETYLETVEGMQFNRGFLSPYFVTDNKTMRTTLDNPSILITADKINNSKDILPFLEMCSNQNKPIVIIAEDIGPEVLSILVVNKMRGILQGVAVKAPDFGDKKKQTLEDIAVLTGGTVISKEKGMLLSKLDTNWLGASRKVTVDKDSTTIVDGGGQESDIALRVEELKAQIDETTSPYEIENLQKRLSRLIGGVSVIHVGGFTEVELRERKDRIEDALHATRAALEEGILPGGGVALLRTSTYLSKLSPEQVKLETPGELLGFNLLTKALETPIRTILTNSIGNTDKRESIINTVNESDNLWTGYNPRQLAFVDLYESGIIDPRKVTRLALENAISVAGTLLTTEAVIALDREELTEQAPSMESMMGM